MAGLGDIVEESNVGQALGDIVEEVPTKKPTFREKVNAVNQARRALNTANLLDATGMIPHKPEDFPQKPQAAPQPESKTLAQTAIGFPRSVADAAAGLLSGMVTFPLSKAAGVATLVGTGGDTEAAKAVEEGTAQQVQFQPDTEFGKKTMEAVGSVLDPAFSTLRKAADLPLESWGAPEWLRYLTHTGVEFGVPAKLHGKIRQIREFRNLPDVTAPKAIEPTKGGFDRVLSTKGADALDAAAKAGEAELGDMVEIPVADQPQRLRSKVEQSNVQEPAPTAQPGGVVAYRDKTYVIDSVNLDTGEMTVFGREKPIKPKHAKIQADMVDIEDYRNTRGVLESAGYPVEELNGMSLEDMKQKVTARIDEASKAPTVEYLQKAKAVDEGIQNYFRQKAVADVETLKTYGLTDDQIAVMSKYEIRDAASDIRTKGKVDVNRNKSDAQLERTAAHMDEFERLMKEFGDKPIEELTPEQNDQLVRALGESTYESEIADAVVRDLSDQTKLLEEGVTDDYLAQKDIADENYAIERAAMAKDKKAMRKMLDATEEVRGRVVDPEEAKVYLKSRFGKRKPAPVGDVQVTKVPEYTKEMAEAKAEPLAKGPRARKQLVTDSSADWEAKLAEEGMPSELNFDEFLSKAQVQSIDEFFANPENHLTKIDQLMGTKEGRAEVGAQLMKLKKKVENGTPGEQNYFNLVKNYVLRRRAYDVTARRAGTEERPWSVTDSRNSIVKGYGYMPSAFDKSLSLEGYLEGLRDIERKAAENDTAHRTGPSVRVELNRLRDSGEITEAEHAWMDAIMAGFDGRANFDLIMGSRLKLEDAALQAEGLRVKPNSYYTFATNLMRVRNIVDFVHEVGHPAFDMLLDGRDRIAYTKAIIDNFYKDGKLDQVALAEHLGTTNVHELLAPSEIFSAGLQNYIARRATNPIHKVLYDKVIDFAKGILRRALGSGVVPMEMREIYGKVWSDLNHPDILNAPKSKIVRGPGAAVRRVQEPLGTVDLSQPLPSQDLTVFHGNGTWMERFRNRFIGSGEGAQVRGWGHYFTLARSVAEWYAKKIGGKKIQESPNNLLESRSLLSNFVGGELYEAVSKGPEIFESTRGKLLAEIQDEISVTQDVGQLDALAKLYDEVSSIPLSQVLKAKKSVGKYVYDVELPDDIILLDLDRPLFAGVMNRVYSALEQVRTRTKSKVNKEQFDDWGRRTNTMVSDLLYDMELDVNTEAKYGSVFGKPLSEDILSPYDQTVLAIKGEPIDTNLINILQGYGIEKVPVEFEGKTEYVGMPMTGDLLQTRLQQIFGHKGASKFLYKHAGVDGNTYIGDTSNVRNYVIFDESIPKVKSYVTLDSLGFQQIYDGLIDMYQKMKNKKANAIEKTVEQLGAPIEEADRINRGMPMKDKEGNVTTADPYPGVNDAAPWTGWNPLKPPLGAPALPGVKRGKWSMGWADETPVEQIVVDANKGEMASSFHHANNTIGLREVQMDIARANLTNEAVTKYIREGRTDGSPVMNEIAGKVRDWLDYMRDRYRDFLKGEYARHLSKKEAGALSDLINGKTLAEVGKKWKIKNLDVVDDIFKKYNELENWGIDDYLPKVELGSYRILDENGVVKAVAMSQKHAVEKILGLIDENPSYQGDFFIDNTSRSALTEQLTGLNSRKQYYSIVNKLANAIAGEVEGIDKGIAKKMAERSTKKVFSVKPTDKYSEFAEKRREVLRGEEDIFPVLAKYSRIMEKKMAIDPVIHEYKKNVRPLLNNMPNLRNLTDQLLEDVKGRYWQIDKCTDWMLAKPYTALEKMGVDVGPPPIMTASRVLGKARAWEANVKLGYRPANAAVNLISGQGHVWAKVGEKYIVDAYRLWNSPEGKNLMKELGPYMGMSFAEEGVGKFSTRRAGETSTITYGKPLGLFQAAELPNREIGLLANYLMAREKFGMSEAAAKETAIRGNWFQNFTYNMANTPQILRGPGMRTLTQFKTYLFREMNFLSSLRSVELARYMSMQLVLGGPRAGLYLLKSLPIIAAVAHVDDIERWLNAKFPRASRGLPGLVGADISAMAAFQLPTDLQDLLGPTLSDLTNVYKDMVAPWLTERTKTLRQTMTLSQLNNHAMNNMPFWRNWNDIWNNVLAGDGRVKDPTTGRIARDQPLWEDTDSYYKKVLEASGYTTKRALGAQDMQVSTQKLEEKLDNDEEKRLNEALRNINQDITKRLANKEEIPQWLWDRKFDLMQKGKDVTGRGLKTSLEDQLLPPTVRRLRRKSQTQKQDILEHAPEFD